MKLSQHSIIGSITLFLAIFIPPANAADALVNGSFSSSGAGWTGATFSGSGNAACPSGQPNIGTWAANTLAFSYVKTTVYQDVVISKPSKVTLNYETQNRGDQVNTRWFSASLGTTDTGNFLPSTTKVSRSLTFTTTAPNQVVRVSFTGQDQLNWAGCYGTYVTNASLLIEPPGGLANSTPAFESYLPNDLVAVTAPAMLRFGENYICQGGKYGYKYARVLGSKPYDVELESLTILLKIDKKIVGAASSDNFKLLPEWVFGINSDARKASIVDSAAAWSIPGTGTAADVSCEIVAYKEHQITVTTIRS